MPKKRLHALKHLVHPQLSNNHRPRLLHPEWTLLMAGLAMVAVIVVTGFSRVAVSQGGYVLGYATNITVDQVVAQTNQQRAASGLSPLSYDPVLSTAAVAKATDMFKHQYWAHVSPTGKQPWDFIHESGYEYQAAGENLARDFYQTDAMMNAWMASPTHRANIVNGKYTQIGIAVVNGTLEGTETTLVVQLFGRPVGAGSSTPQVAVIQAPTSVPNAATVAGNSVTTSPTEEIDEPSAEDTAPATGVGANPSTEQTTILQRVSVESTAPGNQNQVLAAFSFMTGAIRPWPAFSPTQFVKALAVVMAAVVLSVLVYDWALMWVSPKARLVGHNLAHILFIATVVVLVITFQSGLIQ